MLKWGIYFEYNYLYIHSVWILHTNYIHNLMYTKCKQNIYKMYLTFRQSFIYKQLNWIVFVLNWIVLNCFVCKKSYLNMAFKFCIQNLAAIVFLQKFVEMWDTFCIHFVHILYKPVSYILYNLYTKFCMQNCRV